LTWVGVGRISAVLVVGVILAWVVVAAWMAGRQAAVETDHRTPAEWGRERLYAELQPVVLANCRMERFGEPHDGGYLMCANLLDAIEAGYSYGIAGYDQWGCDISRRFGVPVHQYDCFDLTPTSCPGGELIFHPECVAGRTFTDEDGRPFDTVANQIARNGHTGRQIVLKMDVEGAEWDTILQAPDELFEQIDQIAIEFHGVDNPNELLPVVSKLKRTYHLVHLHFNNYTCGIGIEPFPAWAYEALFVSKRLGVVDPDAPAVTRPHPLDTPTNPDAPDCQYPPARRR
jgi:hypothetical protein